jgi:hypothetical protein
MKKQQIEVIALVALLLALIVAATFAFKPQEKAAKRKTEPSTTEKAEKKTIPAVTEMAWVDPLRVAQAIPTVTGGRDPFKDLTLPAVPIARTATPPPTPVMRNPIPVALDPYRPLPGPDDPGANSIQPPTIVVHGIVFGSTKDTTYVALTADGKAYTLLKGEAILDASGGKWTVSAITPTAVTLSNGTLSARFRLSGGS